MEYKKKEHTVNTDVKTDIDRPAAKASKLRPKQTRDELMKQFDDLQKQNETQDN